MYWIDFFCLKNRVPKQSVLHHSTHYLGVHVRLSKCMVLPRTGTPPHQLF